MPIGLTTKSDGKWRSIVKQAFADQCPLEYDWLAEKEKIEDEDYEYTFDDDEVPF